MKGNDCFMPARFCKSGLIAKHRINGPGQPHVVDGQAAGEQSLARGDYARAMKELTVEARAGDARAQLDLGLLYLNGNGTGRDQLMAYRWLRQAAEKGLPEAQYQVGRLKMAGIGTDKNPQEAADWYGKATAAGNVEASEALAHLYLDGVGVPKDEAQALHLLRPAAEKDVISAQMTLGKMYQDGIGTPKSRNDAALWYRKAAQLGSPEGCYQLAMLLLNNGPDGTAPHPPSPQSVAAVRWLRAAVGQDYAPAQYELGLLHIGGIEATLDVSRGILLLQQAADQGYAPALHRLGVIFAKGGMVAQDQGQGLMYLDLAVDLGDKSAQPERDALAAQLPQAVQQLSRRRAREWADIHGT